MTEIKTKKNTDYSASAVNLCNPPEVKELLERLRVRQSELTAVAEKIEACVPVETRKERDFITGVIGELEKTIRERIDLLGSYQDLVTGEYAVKQRKESITYLPDKIKSVLPKFASAVIEESVNKKALEGLLKGGLVTSEQAKECSIASMSYAYIIKV